MLSSNFLRVGTEQRLQTRVDVLRVCLRLLASSEAGRHRAAVALAMSDRAETRGTADVVPVRLDNPMTWVDAQALLAQMRVVEGDDPGLEICQELVVDAAGSRYSIVDFNEEEAREHQHADVHLPTSDAKRATAPRTSVKVDTGDLLMESLTPVCAVRGGGKHEAVLREKTGQQVILPLAGIDGVVIDVSNGAEGRHLRWCGSPESCAQWTVTPVLQRSDPSATIISPIVFFCSKM